MSSNSGFLDEQGMIDLARKGIEDLRKDSISVTELKRLENILREGAVGEALILSSPRILLRYTEPVRRTGRCYSVAFPS